MPSYFGRYQSGIEAATGNLVPAYTRMAEQTANSLTGLGQNIASGIQQYSKNRDESEMINQKVQGLAEQLQRFESIFGKNPEYADFSKMLSDQAKNLAKISSMSLPAQRGAINGAELAFSQIGTQLQMFNVMKDENLKRNIADGISSTPTTEKVTEDLAYKAGKFSINSNESLLVQRGKFAKDVYQVGENDPNKKIDLSKSLAGWDAGARESLKRAEAAGNPTATVMLEQLNAYANKRKGEEYRANLQEGQEIDESMYNLGRMGNPIYVPSAEELMKMRSMTEPQGEQSVDLNSKLEEEKLKLEKLKKLKESGDYVPSGTPTKALQLMSDFGTMFSNSGKENAILLIADKYKKLGKEITPEVSKEIIDTVEKGGFISELGGNVTKLNEIALFSNPLFAGADVLASSQLPQLTQKEINSLTSEFRIKNAEKYAGENIVGGGGVSKDIERQIKDKTKYINLLENKQNESTVSETTEPSATKSSLSIALPAGKIGTEEKEYALSEQKIKDNVRNWVTENMGVTQVISNPDGTTSTVKLPPANFEDMYRKFKPVPETYTDQSGFVYLRGKDGEWSKIADPAKGLTRKDINEQMQSTFGNIPTNETESAIAKQYNGLVPEEIETLDFINSKNTTGTTGSGIYMVGTFRGKNYDDFRKNAIGLVQAKSGLEELKRISEKSAETLSFDDRNKAKKIQTYIMADMKNDIVGTQVTEQEWKRLEEYISNPTEIFTVEGAERRGYDVVLMKLNSAINNLSKGTGVKVIRKGDAGQSTQQAISQNKVINAVNRGK
jgi:hypothetical protein